MSDTNYIATAVKILESPSCKKVRKKYPILRLRAQLPQKRKKQIILLTLWGKIAQDFSVKYRKNDYILVGGHLSNHRKKYTCEKLTKSKKSKNVILTVTTVYPFIFSS